MTFLLSQNLIFLCFLSLLKNIVNLPSTQTLNCKTSCTPPLTADISSQVPLIPHRSISCIHFLDSNSSFIFMELTSSVILLS